MPEPLALLAAQSAATSHIVRSLTDVDWGRVSPGCPGWTVKEVVAHLATGAQLFNELALGTLDSATWLPERQRRIAENAALAPEALCQRYEEADRALTATFKSLSPQELQATRSHPALGHVPVERLLFMRISEAAIHGWDIQSATNPDARLDAPATPHVVEIIAGVFPSWFMAEKLTGLRRTYRFQVGPPVNATRTLLVDGGKAGWTERGEPDVTLSLDGGDFLLLITGRLSVEALLTRDRAAAVGDQAAARELSDLFKAYGGR